MPRVNLEGSSLKGCSMDERLGIHTNLEGRWYDLYHTMSELVCVCVCGGGGGGGGARKEERVCTENVGGTVL